MKSWRIIRRRYHSENSPEYGYGDYGEDIRFVWRIVEAETVRQAQTLARKIDPRIRFGGRFGAEIEEIYSPSEDTKDL